MIELLKSLQGGRVLDVATGPGGFIHTLVESLASFDTILGIDSADTAAAFARAWGGEPRVSFRQMEAAQMDFPDAAFDTVCLSNSLHHLAAPERVLAEMLRVLRPGGHLVVVEMYCDGQTETQRTHVALHHWWAAVDRAGGRYHAETFTRQAIVARLAGLGLAALACQDLSDLSDDPKDPEGLRQLDEVIDQYLARAAGVPHAAELAAQGQALRQRVHTVGFHSAAALAAVGQKREPNG